MPFTYTHAWTLHAEPARVFRALADAAELRRWFAEDAQVEPRAGGVYRFWGRHTLGTPPQDAARQVVTRLEPGRLLSFLWPIHEVDTDVTFALAPDGRDTQLTLTHDVSDDLPVPHPRELIEQHWRTAIANLEAYLAGRTPALPDYFTNPV